MRRTLSNLPVALALVVVAAVPVAVLAQDDVEITTLARGGHLLVSLELPGAYSDDVREAVASGLETTFSFDVELRRAVAYWPDETVDRAFISASVSLDGLTGRYRVVRTVNGAVEDVRVVEEEGAARELLTTMERLPLFSTRDLETNSDYGVRVRVDRRPRTSWFRWPWDRAAALGRASFTFLP
jgi:hypothetical protein